ncbi:MAG TPA: hypothetical protein VFP59_16435 [Candidatus Angelobacter sp.]|nr:hypothetical protein [Candidatus Angelobacter sp.]
MPKQNDEERVLGRMGAYVLTKQQLETIVGGMTTGACTWDPATNRPDGPDCPPPTGP